jgi:hypothetical protein
MTKKLIFLSLAICVLLIGCDKPDKQPKYNILEHSNILQPPALPLNTETEHFKLYCMPEEKLACQKVLDVAEKNFKQCAIDFNHKYSTKINLYVFSTLKEMHKSVGQSDAPDRVANMYEIKTHSFFTINPEHHGSYHSTESILNLNMHGIASLFIQDKYTNKIPFWFMHGIGLWKSNYIDPKIVNKLTQDHQLIPSVEQLENFDSSSDAYRACSYLVVEYINHQWGWDKILAVLADYDSFEKIFGVSKEKFKDQFTDYLDAAYSKKYPLL